MHHFVLQDFVTIRSAFNIVNVTQSEHGWIDLGGYQDLFAWIDVREVSFATGGTQINVFLQTAPIRDEYLFITMEQAPLAVTAALTAPSVRKMIANQSNNGTGTPYPVSRFLRWQLNAPGTLTAGTWDITFRIICAANAMGSGGMGRY